MHGGCGIDRRCFGPMVSDGWWSLIFLFSKLNRRHVLNCYMYFSPTDFMHTELYLSSLHRRFCLSVWALHLFKFDADHQPDEKNDRNRSKKGAEKQIKGKKRLRDFI